MKACPTSLHASLLMSLLSSHLTGLRRPIHPTGLHSSRPMNLLSNHPLQRQAHGGGEGSWDGWSEGSSDGWSEGTSDGC